MRVVHSSDWHLCFSAYNAITPTGINRREADVARTFALAVERWIALEPDVIVVAGDLFHVCKPTPAAIVHAHRELTRLTRELPGAVVVLVAGNHDLPRASAGGDILPLFASVDRVHVVDRRVQMLHFADRSLSVLGVPDAPGLTRPALDPDPRARWNLCVIHGEVHGMPSAVKTDRKLVEIAREEIGVDRWDYVALGHYHVYTELAPNMFYSGSIDLTSSNPWSELAQAKGFVVRDLETGAHEFHEMPRSREYLDLPAIDAQGLGSAEIDGLIKAAIDAQPIDGAVVRLKVLNITREVAHGLDQRALRSYRKRALNFHLDERRADRVSAASLAVVKRMGTTDDRVREDIAKRELPNDVDRDEMQARAALYMEQAREQIEAKKGGTAEPVPIEPAAAAPTRRAS